ncbi:MAG: hypothetical protein BVN32_06470 [Proteobacteria bacterium ST_bin14]|nr:MAG: hypothetical protein BVN32_06470 [Proteobacteria bacterium ST_bin14]
MLIRVQKGYQIVENCYRTIRAAFGRRHRYNTVISATLEQTADQQNVRIKVGNEIFVGDMRCCMSPAIRIVQRRCWTNALKDMKLIARCKIVERRNYGFNLVGKQAV